MGDEPHEFDIVACEGLEEFPPGLSNFRRSEELNLLQC